MLAPRFARSLMRVTIPLLAVGTLFAADGPVPVGKRVIEFSPKAVVAATAPATPTNPTVEPGKVNWHKTMEDAQAAAKKSGRPVLLFQMMGDLDKQFC